MRELKVWGGLGYTKQGKQIRTIVATRTKKRACELLGISIGHLNNYWSPTGNKIELAIATKRPEVVFSASSSMLKDFKEVI
ncbi:MAG: hypothetical protein JKX99_10105 [Robiginitomaculum sp.]|nr:hypothetical protein [Robiginitomaculum sp.]